MYACAVIHRDHKIVGEVASADAVVGGYRESGEEGRNEAQMTSFTTEDIQETLKLLDLLK